MLERRNLAVALPKFDIVTVNKLFRFFAGFGVIGTFEGNRLLKMAVAADDVSAIICHMRPAIFFAYPALMEVEARR